MRRTREELHQLVQHERKLKNRLQLATTRLAEAERERIWAIVAAHDAGLSIRKIAERIEYSPAAIYSYFPSKDDIFFALAEEGFRLLFRGPVTLPDDADLVGWVRNVVWHVYEFSKTHPEYFALMFLDRTVPQITRNWERFEFVRDGKAQLAVGIQKAIDAGHFPAGTHPHAVFRILVAAILGAAVTRLCGRVAPGEDSDALARDTLEAALTGLRTGFAATYHPFSCDESSVAE